MALYIPNSIFHLAGLLYVRPETFGPYYVHFRGSHLWISDTPVFARWQFSAETYF